MLTSLTYHYSPDLFIQNEMSWIVRGFFLGDNISIIVYTTMLLIFMVVPYFLAQKLKTKYGYYPKAAYGVYLVFLIGSFFRFFGAFTNYVHLLNLR
jgi:hypothetical protein